MGHVRHKAAHLLRISEDDLLELNVLKRSRDARKKNNIVDVYSLSVSVCDEERIVRLVNRSNVSILKEAVYSFPKRGKNGSGSRPVVIRFCWLMRDTGL